MAKANGKAAKKIAAKKEKIAAKCGKAKKVAEYSFLLLSACCLFGCATSDPSSRSTAGKYGDIKVCVEIDQREAISNVVNVTVPVTLGDAAVASADSAGSTETTTATPTLDIKTDITAHYNDAIAAASTASKSVLGQVGDGLTAVLDLMSSKKSGTVAVTKKDGTQATVKCADGQCEFCEDCEL